MRPVFRDVGLIGAAEPFGVAPLYGAGKIAVARTLSVSRTQPSKLLSAKRQEFFYEFFQGFRLYEGSSATVAFGEAHRHCAAFAELCVDLSRGGGLWKHLPVYAVHSLSAHPLPHAVEKFGNSPRADLRRALALGFRHYRGDTSPARPSKEPPRGLQVLRYA